MPKRSGYRSVKDVASLETDITGKSTLHLTQATRIQGRLNFLGQYFLCGLALLGWLAVAAPARSAESSFTEYQVKALFLLNFAKYVDWPADAFSSPEAPFTIGVLGANKFGGDLEKAVVNKNISGRKIIVRQVEREDEWFQCHILFISASERKRLPDVLAKIRKTPVLTVGETEQFTEQGGIIRFVKKEEKVRLEIDLRPAREARLQISSKLLSVADSVKGKP